ncbi:MAG: hypothetical protein HY474_01070 [Candidatus Sungbacteria bacterium]|uniref:DoxX family protein n=1 Tax=Candidatus Sungiibacteriota bacterium TaxID=2750080 RepID=A0A932YXQ9_9BACT|nr:hypothetical protein [Candidatus Sungbacteria bacterium]
MDILRKFHPLWALRIGLGLMYVYSGTSLIRQPLDWQGFLPPWFGDFVGRFMPLPTYFAIQGAGELVMAAVFILPLVPLYVVRIAAVAAALEFAGILLFTGLDLVTFRDIGLLGAAVALVVMSSVRLENNKNPFRRP